MTEKNKKSIWLDVRTLEEYSDGHIKGALHIPYDELAERHEELGLKKEAHIKLYCRSGRRSDVGMKIMQRLGYENAVNEGGYEDLIAQGNQSNQD